MDCWTITVKFDSITPDQLRGIMVARPYYTPHVDPSKAKVLVQNPLITLHDPQDAEASYGQKEQGNIAAYRPPIRNQAELPGTERVTPQRSTQVFINVHCPLPYPTFT